MVRLSFLNIQKQSSKVSTFITENIEIKRTSQPIYMTPTTKIEVVLRMCSRHEALSGDGTRPSGFSKETVFQNLLKTRDENTNITVLFDGDSTAHWIHNYEVKVVKFEGGGGHESFLFQINYIKSQNFRDDTIIYILEDDYLHKDGWCRVLREGLGYIKPSSLKFDYITLYDHGDKYFYEMYYELASRIGISETVHWRTVPSTTNTFAMMYSTFIKDFEIHKEFLNYDHRKFLALGEHGSIIGSCIPGYSTHCHKSYMSPFFNYTVDVKNKNTALIVEPRNLERLPLIIKHFQDTLGPDWNLVFYCGVGLKEHWSQHLKNVDIRELQVSNLNAETYSDLFKNIDFWESFSGEWILTFQTDAWIVNNPPFTIDYFIQRNKSYIGGNMDFLWDYMPNMLENPIIGHYNGGLSLRKKSDMTRILNDFPPMITIEYPNAKRFEESPEDVYFTVGCYKLNLPIGSNEEDSHFAIHKIFHSSFFGVHRPRDEIKPLLLSKHPNMTIAYM